MRIDARISSKAIDRLVERDDEGKVHLKENETRNLMVLAESPSLAKVKKPTIAQKLGIGLRLSVHNWK